MCVSKDDFALHNLEGLKCHKSQPSNKPIFLYGYDIYIMLCC